MYSLSPFLYIRFFQTNSSTSSQLTSLYWDGLGTKGAFFVPKRSASGRRVNSVERLVGQAWIPSARPWGWNIALWCHGISLEKLKQKRSGEVNVPQHGKNGWNKNIWFIHIYICIYTYIKHTSMNHINISWCHFPGVPEQLFDEKQHCQHYPPWN